jgi:hypothetical protein
VEEEEASSYHTECGKEFERGEQAEQDCGEGDGKGSIHGGASICAIQEVLRINID